MPMSLTPRQADCARAFAELQEAAGCAPTIRELALALDCNVENAARLLNQLEERGWIARLPHRARGVRLLHPPPPAEEYEVAVTDGGLRYLEAAERSRGP